MKMSSTAKPDSTITPYFSDKMKVVSFISIIIVFFIHSSFPQEPYATKKFPIMVNKCLSGTFGNLAVPMFYVISGWLFFYRTGKIQDVFIKMRRRVRTLFIPFVIAAVFYPLFFIVMEMIPHIANHIDRPSYIEMCKTMSWFDIIIFLLYGAWNGYPIAYHLWFMKDLITIVMLCPFVYCMRKYTGYWAIVILFLLYMLIPHVSLLYALFWFVSGSLLLNKLHKVTGKVVALLFCLFFILVLYRHIIGYQRLPSLLLIEVSCGLCAFWSLYDKLVSNRFRLINNHYLNTACQYVFFLYLYHEPVYHIIVKLILIICGANTVGATMSILLPPILFTPIGLAIGVYLKRFFPKLYFIIVGGRM